MQHYWVFNGIGYWSRLLFVCCWVTLVAGCAPAVKKVAIPVEQPQVEVGVPEPEPLQVEPAPRQEEPEIVEQEKQPQIFVEEMEQPKVVVEEKLVLPDGEMFAARYGYYEKLQNSFRELSYHLDWLSLEESSPELQNCISLIESLQDGYRRGLEIVDNGPTADSAIVEELQPWQVVWKDMSFIQGSCEAVFDRKTEELAKLLEKYEGGEYADREEMSNSMEDRAIESYRYLMQNFPEWRKKPSVLRQFGQALLRRGQLKEAGDIFAKVLMAEESVRQDLSLRRETADLLLASGRIEQAVQQYKALADAEDIAAKGKEITAASLDLLEGRINREPLLSIYQNFLWEFYTFDGIKVSPKARTSVTQLKSYFPYSPLTENARSMLASMEKKVRQVVQERLKTAELLADEKQFTEAKKVLQEIPSENLPADLAENIHQTLQEIAFDAEEDQRTFEWNQKEQLSSRWQRAEDLFEQHLYDAAIDIYSSFRGTEYEQKAAAMLLQTVDQAAVDLRKEAASLFLKAHKEKDPFLRRSYLTDSLELLKKIEEKYPQTTIYDKVQRNMAALEEEISSLNGPENLP
jgi:tetratricopeptide (TPR) repeat protein